MITSRYRHYCRRPAKPSLVGLSLILLALTALILVSFVCISIPTNVVNLSPTTIPVHYVGLIPLLLGTSALLGAWLGLGVSLLYLGFGLFGLPLFANGGGIHYWQTPGFSYLLSFPLAAWFCGRLYQRGKLTMGWGKIAFITSSVVLPLLLIHLLGALGLCLQVALGYMDVSTLTGWIQTLSLNSIVVDGVVTVILIMIAVPVLRYSLWWLL